jgi:hypothetical protein
LFFSIMDQGRAGIAFRGSILAGIAPKTDALRHATRIPLSLFV